MKNKIYLLNLPLLGQLALCLFATGVSAQEVTVTDPNGKIMSDTRVSETVRLANEEQKSITTTYDESGELRSVKAEEAEEDKLNLVGFSLNVGVPAGIGLDLTIRPYTWLRSYLGVTHNLGAPGLRAGATLAPPVVFPLLPTATFEMGHVFARDYNKLVGIFSDSANDTPFIRSVSYNYINGLLGVEIGHKNWFLFTLKGGISTLWATLDKFDSAVRSEFEKHNTEGVTVKSAKDLKVRYTGPAFQAGFTVYFWGPKSKGKGK